MTHCDCVAHSDEKQVTPFHHRVTECLKIAPLFEQEPDCTRHKLKLATVTHVIPEAVDKCAPGLCAALKATI